MSDELRELREAASAAVERLKPAVAEGSMTGTVFASTRDLTLLLASVQALLARLSAAERDAGYYAKLKPLMESADFGSIEGDEGPTLVFRLPRYSAISADLGWTLDHLPTAEEVERMDRVRDDTAIDTAIAATQEGSDAR